MNQTSRTDETYGHPEWNQNPPSLNPEATTRQDLNGMVNLRDRRDHQLETTDSEDVLGQIATMPNPDETAHASPPAKRTGVANTTTASNDPNQPRTKALTIAISVPRFLRPIVKFGSFIGPGFLIAVAYIDPGNYSTDAAAGASSRYALLFVVLMSNLFAVFLQSLCIKLGSVTGLNLAENCRLHLPKWLAIALYILSEGAIIATDIAEVSFSLLYFRRLLYLTVIR
jgi:metal iron transporter